MKKTYILIDLNSFILYSENQNGSYSHSVNKNIFSLLKELMTQISSEKNEFIIMFCCKKNQLVNYPKLIFLKYTDLKVGMSVPDIINYFVKYFEKNHFKNTSVDLTPYVIDNKQPSLFDIQDFKKVKNILNLNSKSLLIVASNTSFLNSNSEANIIFTHMKGDLNLEGLKKLDEALKTTKNPSIHWFVDIDETLLLRYESKKLKKVFLNKHLVTTIQTSVQENKKSRISVLTARKNPYQGFRVSANKLEKILNEFKIKNKDLTHALSTQDNFDSFSLRNVIQQVLISTDALFLNNPHLPIDKLRAIESDLSSLYNFINSSPFLLVESIKNCCMEEAGLNLCIEPFSYVDTTANPKAHTISLLKNANINLSEDSDDEIIVFTDDSRTEIKAALELKLTNANKKFIVIPIHHEGDLELSFQEKILQFIENINSEDLNITSRKRKLDSLEGSIMFWKMPEGTPLSPPSTEGQVDTLKIPKLSHDNYRA